MSRRSQRVLLIGTPLIVIAIVASFAVAVLARAAKQAGSYQSSQPDYGTAPTFSLIDQNGKKVTSSDLAGKVQVVTFLFPYCTTFCPTITHTLAELEADLKQEGIFGTKVDIVAFNVDPTGSGPAEMRAFLKQYGVSPTDPGWTYLTGSKTAVDRAIRDGYHVYYSKVSLAQEQKDIAREKAEGTYTPVKEEANPLAERKHVDYDIVHEDYIQIVGADGHIRQIFNGDTPSEAQLFAAVRQIAAGQSETP